MRIHLLSLLAAVLVVAALAGCIPRGEAVEIKSFPLDSADEIGALQGVTFDKDVSADGKGSWKIVTDKPTVVTIAETGDIDVEDARIIYRAKVRTKDFDGQVFIEMWCSFAGKGEFFSKGLQSVLSGTTDWTTMETPFFLKKGENPDNVRMNLVLNGKGTAWIDDVKVLKGAL